MAELYGHQKEGVAFLAARPRAILADKPGLGKTLQAIRAADELGAGDVLVVCPASLKLNWAREFRAHQLVDRPIHVVESRKRIPDEGVVIVNYDLVHRQNILNQLVLSWWDVLILDEAHYTKTPSTQRTRAVYGVGCTAGDVSLAGRAEHVWALTGTPTPNGRPGELWPTLRALAPERIEKAPGKPMSFWDFQYRYSVVKATRFGKKILGAQRLPELKARLQGLMLRRTQGADLPPLRVCDLTVSNDKALREIRKLEKHPEFEELRNLLKDPNADLSRAPSDELATLRRMVGIAKVQPVAQILADELAQDPTGKVVVFAWHREVLDLLEEALAEFGAVRVDGSTPSKKRQLAVDAFQQQLETRVFIGQIVAAGTGLTLTAARSLVVVEPSYVPADNEQAMLRIHRISQTRSCLVRFAALGGSIDEDITELITRKARDIKLLYDVGNDDRQSPTEDSKNG